MKTEELKEEIKNEVIDSLGYYSIDVEDLDELMKDLDDDTLKKCLESLEILNIELFKIKV